jgi:hypothetical protein
VRGPHRLDHRHDRSVLALAALEVGRVAVLSRPVETAGRVVVALLLGVEDVEAELVGQLLEAARGHAGRLLRAAVQDHDEGRALGHVPRAVAPHLEVARVGAEVVLPYRRA